MFDSVDAAQHTLQSFLEPHQVQEVVQALVPAVALQPTPGGAPGAPGASRLGGLPDLPGDAVWPRPVPPADPEVIARRGSDEAAQEMREHLRLGLPYAFVGQIDLAEAHTLGAVAADLPAQGRLLFFYDLSVGPWESGSRVARVLWDASQAAALQPLAMPADLLAAHQAGERMNAEILREFGGDVPEQPYGTNYGAPAQPVSLHVRLGVPAPAALEIRALPTLQAFYQGQSKDAAAERFADAYDEMRQELGLEYPPESWRRHQLLGSPLPEQDDPRYQAVITTEYGEEFLAHETWLQERERIMTRAQDWRLLLQVDLADWTGGDLGQGTVYFLIRTQDLAARRFDQVVAVYQQT